MGQVTPDLVLDRYIDTSKFGERPHLRGRRIPVATVAYHARDNGWDIQRLTGEFKLSQSEVLAALLYYEEHHAEIDAQEQAYQDDLNASYTILRE
jgi:uncharacterized protein (DUF433 family)